MEKEISKSKMKMALFRHFSCSETMLTLLDRMGGTEWQEVEEASDPLCAGILFDLDAACGILWGGSLSAGIMAQRSFLDPIAAKNAALRATRKLFDEYNQQEDRVNCGERINMRKWNFLLYMLKGNSFRCQNNIAGWAPRFREIIDSSMRESVEDRPSDNQQNCACMAMDKVGQAIGLDTTQYAAVPAGLAGGLGLSGSTCGALAAAIFTQCLKYFHSRTKSRHGMVRSILQGFYFGIPWLNPSMNLNEEFKQKLGTKSCKGITNKVFSNNAELSDFLRDGGCSGVIDRLAELAVKYQAA